MSSCLFDLLLGKFAGARLDGERLGLARGDNGRVNVQNPIEVVGESNIHLLVSRRSLGNTFDGEFPKFLVQAAQRMFALIHLDLNLSLVRLYGGVALDSLV